MPSSSDPTYAIAVCAGGGLTHVKAHGAKQNQTRVIPPQEPLFMFKRILVPVDGSPASQNALALAAGLARSSGGQLRLVHVLEDVTYLAGYDPTGASAGELFRVMRESGARILGQAQAAAAAAQVPADTVLVDDAGKRLENAVADIATEWRAELIVVGTHGRRGVSRLMLGSGAEQIIRTAPVPVLVARQAEDEGQAAS
jgi:nucleotide-binding universal stress UspA family protein